MQKYTDYAKHMTAQADLGIHHCTAKLKPSRKPARFERPIEIDGRIVGYDIYERRGPRKTWLGRKYL